MTNQQRKRRKQKVRASLARLIQLVDGGEVKPFTELEEEDQQTAEMLADSLIDLVDALLEPHTGGK